MQSREADSGIAAYLEAEFPDPPLLGTNSEEKGLIATWNTKMEMNGLWAVAEALRNSSPAMKDRALTGSKNYAQIPELAQRGLDRLNDFMQNLESRLEGRDYIVTNRFTIVDISAVVAVDFARIVKVVPGEQHPNILRWRELLAQRPSISS